jgi:hypothetical protein
VPVRFFRAHILFVCLCVTCMAKKKTFLLLIIAFFVVCISHKMETNSWVERQRTAYQHRQKRAKLGGGGERNTHDNNDSDKKKKTRKDTALTDERLKRLQSIGFRFETAHCDFEQVRIVKFFINE